MNRRREVLEFGPFRINQGERLLRRAEGVVPIPPKATALLMALVERPGEFIDKQELLNVVWPDTFVEDGSLTQMVSLLRKALGASVESPYIETIPRRGYRFVAPVITIREERGRAPALAVLPLANLSADASQDVFVDGMTDELITCLMHIEALRISSRTSVMAYRNSGKTLQQIAHELQVDWIVEGAVLQVGPSVRITARLIDASTDHQLWVHSYERQLSEVLALQSAIATDIATQVRVKVTSTQQSQMTPARRVDPEAYDAYLRGRHFSNRRTREDLRRAVDYFRVAIDRDPTYAPAHAGLADSYALLGTIGFDVVPPRDAMPRASAAAGRALEIDGTMAQAHAALGYVKLSYEWDSTAAEERFTQAIAANPTYATAYHWYGHCLFATARLEEAAVAMCRAQQLDPLSVPFNLGIGWASYYQRRYDDAIEQYEKTLEIAPGVPLVMYELGLAYQNKGSLDQALEWFERASVASKNEPASVMLRGHIYALLGRAADARRQREKLVEMSNRQYVPALYTAFIYAGERNADEAFAWFDRACDERSSYMIYLDVEPSLDHLRGDPRFEALVQRVGVRGNASGALGSAGPRGNQNRTPNPKPTNA